VNIQFMVKDSKKYAATGGWGFADFKNGKPGDEGCTKPAFPVTSLPKVATTSSLTTHQRPELKQMQITSAFGPKPTLSAFGG